MSRAFRALVALVYAAAVAIVAAWAITYPTWPFGWDHGAFAWVGDVIARGGMPYRDAFDVKGPLSFYPSALVQLVAGRNWWGIRAFDLPNGDVVAVAAPQTLPLTTAHAALCAMLEEESSPAPTVVLAALHRRRSTLWRRFKWTVSHWLVTSMDYTVTRRLNFRKD